MDTTKVNLIFFDTEERFEDVKSQISTYSYKSIKRLNSIEEFESYIADFNNDDYFIVFIHIVAATLEGYYSGLKDDLRQKFPNLQFHWITRAGNTVSPDKVSEPVQCYVHIKKQITENQLQPQLLSIIKNKTNLDTIHKRPFNYAIITALEKDEMSKVLPIIEETDDSSTDTMLIKEGHLKSDSNKLIVYASMPKTGMIDASIVATSLIERYKPKYLIMAGVLAGKPEDTNIGDVVVANSIFTIDKGKMQEENLSPEHEIVPINTSAIARMERDCKSIERFIEDLDPIGRTQIKIHFSPIACVRHVVDKQNYFSEEITIRDRKTLGLEMESYGIARACELANNGDTTPLIIKSVMDNASNKTDEYKSLAAFTSASFVQYILENQLI